MLNHTSILLEPISPVCLRLRKQNKTKRTTDKCHQPRQGTKRQYITLHRCFSNESIALNIKSNPGNCAQHTKPRSLIRSITNDII
jgi:hypothetical protein